MKKGEIMEALKTADKPLSVEELSEETGISVPNLRVDLYRLQEEGTVESREEERELKWKVKVSEPVEEKYEKMSKKQT